MSSVAETPASVEETGFDLRALERRLLQGAAERSHAHVAERKRRERMDDKGHITFTDLRADMLRGADRDFGG